VSAGSLKLLVAHELGHNFGAPHDGRKFTESLDGCLSTPVGFIMWQSFTSVQTFSPCSKGYMGSAVEDASCLSAGFPGGGGGPGPAGCVGTLTPASRDHGPSSGRGRVKVTADGLCAWAAQSNSSWITISSSTTNTGTRRVSYRIAANPSTAARTGTLTLAGRTFTVTQRGTSN
jgi:hypothetical protein